MMHPPLGEIHTNPVGAVQPLAPEAIGHAGQELLDALSAPQPRQGVLLLDHLVTGKRRDQG